jgi:hypothetical protein
MSPLIVDRMKFLFTYQILETLPIIPAPTHHPYQLYDAYQ